ncbi:MAG: hydrogenase maturation nickel metallochaperone HypA [Armatimonadia bacterium]|nr:hydrogenase maturation nickel metallochaperone HypA [Armatimonadia bacterium]
MHEYSIACRLIEAVESGLDERGVAAPVGRVEVLVGELSGVVPEALELAFEAAKTETRLAGAELALTIEPLVLWCESCRREWHAAEPFLICDECGGTQVEIRSGRGLSVTGVDVEDEQRP